MEKKILNYAYVLQNCPTIEYIVCGPQTYERIVCENYFNSQEVQDGGSRTIDLRLARQLLYH